jgi:hypothetical protein
MSTVTGINGTLECIPALPLGAELVIGAASAEAVAYEVGDTPAHRSSAANTCASSVKHHAATPSACVARKTVTDIRRHSLGSLKVACQRSVPSRSLGRTRVVIVAFWATRVLSSMLFQVGARDPIAYGAATAVLLLWRSVRPGSRHGGRPASIRCAPAPPRASGDGRLFVQSRAPSHVRTMRATRSAAGGSRFARTMRS